MDRGREARWEEDAMTVEIVFALVTAAVLAGAVFAVAWAAVQALGLSGAVRGDVLRGGAVVGGVAGVWRVVRVLVRFDGRRRMGR
jgi:hypothetical protein